MAGFTDATELAILALILAGTTFNDIAENDSTTPNTEFYLSGHTADPGDTGNQTTSETTFTDYAREQIDRSGAAGGFDVSANPAVFQEDHAWPQASGGTATLTHFGLGKASSGTGVLYGSGAITPNISVVTSVTAILTDATSIALD